MSLIILNVDEVRRTLSASGGAFVVHDKEVDIVRFAINSGFADIVLDGQVALRVMYQRPGETEVRAQTLTYYDTDGLHNYYDWNLLPSDLAEKGTLTVALCILRTDGDVEEWHTAPCQVRVLDTIHTDDSDEGDETITPTVAQRVAVLESVIQGMAGGAPVVVSNASEMTDTDKIYVLSTDGNWYYHNGSAWVAGGEYGAVATDTTLTQSGTPADAKAVGDGLTDIKRDLRNLIKVPKSVSAYRIINGGLARNGSNYDFPNNTRVRTQYIPFDSEGFYCVTLESNDYKIERAFSYSSGSQSSVIDSLSVFGNIFYFKVDSNSKYLRFSFIHAGNVDISMTDEDKTAIANAIKFYVFTDASLTLSGVSADAKTVGQVADIFMKMSNHSIMPPIGTNTYPTGWRVGMYNDSGTVANSTDSICRAQRIGVPGGDMKRAGAVGIVVESPYGGCTIKRFRDGSLFDVVYGSKKTFCEVDDSDLISVTITNLENPESYITGELIDNIKVYMIYREKQNEYYTTEEYFTVPINKAWINNTVDTENTVNVDCVLKLPPNYSPGGEPVRLVFMHHGNSGTVNVENRTWYSESSVWVRFVNAYLNAGYAVFDVNGCGPVSDPNASHDYASFGALQAAYKAYEYIKDKYNIKERIFVHGSSMGGATVYAFTKIYGSIVDAVGLFSPALLSRSAQLSETAEGYIAVNYGYEDAEEMVADNYSHLIPSNPKIQYYHDGAKVEKPFTYDWVNNYESDDLEIVCADFPCPVKIWCGTADTAVDPNYGDALAKAITNSGKLAIFRPVDGENHNAGIGSNSTVNAEAVMWFNRFN